MSNNPTFQAALFALGAVTCQLTAEPSDMEIERVIALATAAVQGIALDPDEREIRNHLANLVDGHDASDAEDRRALVEAIAETVDGVNVWVDFEDDSDATVAA